MTKTMVLQSLEIYNISYRVLTKKERDEKCFPKIALLCHGDKFQRGFYLTGKNWQEVYETFLHFYVSNPFGDY